MVSKRAFIFGAGASHAYDRSKFGVRPPLARGFFDAYFALPISDDFDVKVGSIVNYVRDNYGIPWHEFHLFDENVEQFLVRLDNELAGIRTRLNDTGKDPDEHDFGQLYTLERARAELLLLFSRVLIDTTDGLDCPFHALFAGSLREGDVIIDFNWDTLLDRALFNTGKWYPDDGYGVSFEAIMDGEWRLPNQTASEFSLLKLHGSINWLISYPGIDYKTGAESAGLPPDRYHDKFCFVSLEPHPPFGCREVLINPLVPPRRKDDKAFIVGNVEIDRETGRYAMKLKTHTDYTPQAKLAPLIIQPTANKNYQLPGQVFEQLWPAAIDALKASDDVYVCGYSLPDTDDRPRELLRQAAAERQQPWQIHLVTPHPDDLEAKLKDLLGDKAEIHHAASSFQEFAAPNTYDLILPGPAADS